MVILIQTHKKILKKIKIKAIIIIAILLCLAIGSIYQWNMAKKILKNKDIEIETLNNEIKSLILKVDIINALKSKPLTIGQAIEIIEVIASQKDVPIPLAIALIEQESEFIPNAISYKGARGLTQLMPNIIKTYVKDSESEKYIDRPSVNVKVGLKHLSNLKSKYGTWEKALNAYFAGEDEINNKIYDWYHKSVLRKSKKYAYLMEK